MSISSSLSYLILVGAAMALMQTKLSKGVLKSKVPRDCAVKAELSNLSNTSCFQDGWGKGHQDYSLTKILLKQL